MPTGADRSTVPDKSNSIPKRKIMFMLNKCCYPHFILESYFASDGNKNTLNKLSMVTVHGHSVVASPCFPLVPASSILLTAYNDLYINIGTNSFFTLLHSNNQQEYIVLKDIILIID